MAYTINGKVYTDHPLMDEMIYNLDIIMKNVEIKNEDLALKCETEETMEASDNYISIYEGTMSFDLFPFTEEYLVEFGYSAYDASKYVVDRSLIPEKDRDELLKFCCNKYLEDYTEENNYYRSLMGLPWIDEDRDPEYYYVYIDESYISDPYIINLFDYNIPLHEYTDYQISILDTLGVIDKILDDENYLGKEYRYLRFLGDKKRDNYKIRIAAKWDILYMPSVEELVSDRFKQLFQINRDMYLHRYYDEAYKIQSEYYDEFMIILLLCQTYTDMISEIPEWYVRRDIFDLRSCQYFMEASGVEFFKVIPLKYQIRIVKNLNKLIRYKSTNKNIWDIIDIFDIDATVYKYYIFKKRIVNERGAYATGKDPADEYELEFVKTAIGDTYDNYIKDNIYREPYDEITYQDKYWDGQDTHQLVKDNHLAKEFTIEGTKYMSLEVNISMSEYSYQLKYFVGMLLASDIDIGNIKINIPSISATVGFSLTDLFILLYCLTASYDDYQLLIRVPEDETYEPKPDFEGYWWDNQGYDDGVAYLRPMSASYEAPYVYINQEVFYDWLAWKYPYLWTNMSCRMYGFNMDADLDELQEIIGMRHSHFHFERGFTLEDLGVEGFITQKYFDSIDELVYVYENNTAIYDHVSDLILTADTRDDRVVYQFVFDYLFTKGFDYDKYTLQNTGELANTYDEVLRERNYILYNYYKDLTAEEDLETRQDQIRDAMNDIIGTLEYYLNYDCLKYIFASFTVTSFNSLVNYMYLLINFFKSWKVYFLDPYVTYTFDDKLENTVYSNDSLGELRTVHWRDDRVDHHDTEDVYITLNFGEGYLKDNVIEVMDLYGHWEPDPTINMDLDGKHVGYMCWPTLQDLDGGEADLDDQSWVITVDGKHPEESTQTYYDIVGGWIGFGYWPSLNDLNGAGPELDEMENLVTINGKHPYDVLPADNNADPAKYYYTISTGSYADNDDWFYEPYNHTLEYADKDDWFSYDFIKDPTIYWDGITTDIDGGGTSILESCPFIQYNGGLVGTGLHLDDLNGDGPWEHDEYLNVDGKTAEELPQYHGVEPRGYDVYGGHPDWNIMVTPTMVVRIRDSQISMDVILAPMTGRKENLVTIKDGDDAGLYLKDIWVSEQDYEDYDNYLISLTEIYNDFYNSVLEEARDATSVSDDTLIKRIEEVTDNYLKTANETYDLLHGGQLEINKEYTDERAAELDDYVDYLINLYRGWGDF